MEADSKSSDRKILLRIPQKLARGLGKVKGETKINAKISQAVDKFLDDVVPEEFKRLYVAGLSRGKRHTGPAKARRMGFFPSSENATKQRVRFGTVLSAHTLDRLKIISTWAGSSRQSAVDACIAYYFQIPGAPNPDRGQFSRFNFPLLSGQERLTRNRLRWLVEYADL